MMIPHKHNLMIRMLKRAARARREHGIALLFTLCILSMALITAMIFSSTASTGRKVAGAYADSSAAKILADGVVNRAILALMQSDSASSYVCSNYNSNKPSGKVNYYGFDWIWKLERNGLFSFDDGPLRFSKNTYYDYKDLRCPSWEYVITRDIYGGSQAQKRIYGRYAYVGIGQNDQLNPNAIGNRNHRNFDPAIFKKRLGRWTCEPDFNFESSRNRWDKRFAKLITPEKISEKYLNIDTATKNWPDLDLFFGDLLEDEDPASDDVRQFKMMAEQYFDVSSQREFNKFRTDGKPADLTKHDLEDNNEHYRFPLLRTDWDSISFETVKSSIPWFDFSPASNQLNITNPDQVVANLINYNASANRDPVTNNANWISGENITYTGNKRTPYINEVYADVKLSGHLGMRRQEHYLPPGADTSTGWKWRVWYTNCTYSHKVTIDIETVNMYPSSGRYGVLPVSTPIPIGEITYQYFVPDQNAPNPDAAGGDWRTETVRIDANTQWSSIDSYPGDDGYMIYSLTLDNSSVGSVTTPRRDNYESPMGHEGHFYDFIKVRHVKLSLDRVVLRDQRGRNADLSMMHTNLRNETGNNSNIFMPLSRWADRDGGETVAGQPEKSFYFDTQADDPRQNLRRTDWRTPSFNVDSARLSPRPTVGSVNSTISYNSGNRNFDYEKQSNPAYTGNNSISTAFIRHEPMESLWELGAIHRGNAWQTVNLKCAGARTSRMGSYDNGDGHLLDQVALTERTDTTSDYVIGMINLNCVASFGGSSAPFTFKSLFTEFPLFRNYTAMIEGKEADKIKGGTVDSDNGGDLAADAYAKELADAVTYAISNGHYLRRTAVLPLTYPGSGRMEKTIPASVPDAQAEEVFSRVVNLLKWNRQQIRRATVLVLAQTIKDVGGANGGGVSLKKVMPKDDDELMLDAGFQSFRTDKRTSASVAAMSADTIRKDFESKTVNFNQYDNFYDEITGEAKIIVYLEWKDSANNNNGAWVVTRKEYVE